MGAGAVIRQVPVAGLNAAPTEVGVRPHTITSVPDHTAVAFSGASVGAGGSVTIVSGATSVNNCVWPVGIVVGGAVGVVDGTGADGEGAVGVGDGTERTAMVQSAPGRHRGRRATTPS
jgi:hypothetical protein